MNEYPPPIAFADFTAIVIPHDPGEDDSLDSEVSRSEPTTNHRNVLNRKTCAIRELLLTVPATGAKSVSYTARGAQHAIIASADKKRFCFAPVTETARICWKIDNPPQVAGARVQLFSKNIAAGPIWSIDLAPDDLVPEGGATGRIVDHYTDWDGRFPANTAGYQADFPDGCVTAGHSPYKLHMTIKPKRGVNSDCVEAWTYFDVLVKSIELSWGDKKTISRKNIDPQWKERVRKLQKGIVDDLKQKTDNAGKFDVEHTVGLMSNLFTTDLLAQARDDTMYREYRKMWGDGPQIPIYAKIRVRDSAGNAVDAPFALGKTPFLWDWDDLGEDKVKRWTKKEQQVTKDFLYSSLDYKVQHEADAGFAPAGSNNCHKDHGGKRGRGAARVFPTRDATSYNNASTVVKKGRFPFRVTACTNRKWAALSYPRTRGLLAGSTGVMFQPSRMAGDYYRVNVYLAGGWEFPWNEKGGVLRKKCPAPMAAAGSFEVCRRLNMHIIRKSAQAPDIDMKKIKRQYFPAGIQLGQAAPQVADNAHWQNAFNTEIAAQRTQSSYQNNMPWVEMALADAAGQAAGPCAVVYVTKDQAKQPARVAKAFAESKVQKLVVNGGAFNATSTQITNQRTNKQSDVIFQRPTGTVNETELIVRHPGVNPAFQNGDVITQVGGPNLTVQSAAEPNEGQWNGYAHLNALIASNSFNAAVDRFYDGGNASRSASALATRLQRQYIDLAYADINRFHGTFAFVYKGIPTPPSEPLQGAAHSPTSTLTRAAVYVAYDPATPPPVAGPPKYDGRTQLKDKDSVMGHEIGHALFLQHAPNESNNIVDAHLRYIQKAPSTRDKNTVCLMNYHPGGKAYCGVCILRLRGWAWRGSDDPANAPEVLVPLYHHGPKNYAKTMRKPVMDLPSTTPKTKRFIMGSDTDYNVLPRRKIELEGVSSDLHENPPIVLLAGVTEAAPAATGDGAIDDCRKPVKLRVEWDDPGNGETLVWQVERAKDEKEIARYSQAECGRGLPTLTQHAVNKNEATLLTDAVGTFHVKVAFDPSGGGVFTEKHEVICFNIVLVHVKRLSSAHTYSPNHYECVRSGQDVGVLKRRGVQAPLWVTTRFRAVGGAKDGTRGLDKIHCGWINTLTKDVAEVHYSNTAGDKTWEGRVFYGRKKADGTWVVPDVALSTTHPYLDSGNSQPLAMWGGYYSMLSERDPEKDAVSVYGTRTGGQPGLEATIKTGDAPGGTWDITPPAANDTTLKIIRFKYEIEFRAFCAFFSKSVDNLYGILDEVDWNMGCEFNVDENGPVGNAITAPYVREAAKRHHASLVPAYSTDVEVCPPGGGAGVSFPRNVDGINPLGTGWKSGTP